MPVETRSSSVRIRPLSGVDDPALAGAAWTALLGHGATDTVFLTREWQQAWWESFGRGERLLLGAWSGDRLMALAPLFAEAGMVFFIASGGSDYLDFIGDLATEGALEGLLEVARERTPGFLGFRFYHVPDSSSTGALLNRAARGLGLRCCDEGSLPAPVLELDRHPEAAQSACRKKSLMRHERDLRARGELRIEHLRDGEAIRPHLPDFFQQHVGRWSATPWPSLFQDPLHCRFYERLTELAGRAGWLRFTRLVWNGRPIAYHYGFCYGGSFLWYKPSFAIELARRSPGEVLLRHLLLEAIAEGAHTFDFGLGDEPFKRRFATRVRTVRTWGLYPPEPANAGHNRREDPTL
jgi:CelD/BcsL family acetyltransferase involved in cellulose biosynthesis